MCRDRWKTVRTVGKVINARCKELNYFVNSVNNFTFADIHLK